MFNLINVNSGKLLATSNLSALERLQERIDPFGLYTEIIDDRRALYEPKVASLIDDAHEDIFASMNRKPTVRDLESRTDGFMLFAINDTGWTEDERKAYESHPALIKNSNLKNIIQKIRASHLDKVKSISVYD